MPTPTLDDPAADLDIWFGEPQPDMCQRQTSFGWLFEAERGCGTPVARSGQPSPSPTITMVANGRNPVFARTSFFDYNARIKNVKRWASLSLLMTTESTDEGALCNYAGIMRRNFNGGEVDMVIDQIKDPDKTENPQQLRPGDDGNVFYIVPQMLQRRRTAPYPELRVVFVPLLVEEVTPRLPPLVPSRTHMRHQRDADCRKE